jgi:hypothetical protein
MPSHGHSLGLLLDGYDGGSQGDGVGSLPRGAQSGLTQLEGGDQSQPPDKNGIYPNLPHNNMPPYYALAYIIKYI